MIGDFGYHRNIGGGAGEDRLIDPLHAGHHQSQQPVDAGLLHFFLEGDDNAQN
jgi:hypothetical protein